MLTQESDDEPWRSADWRLDNFYTIVDKLGRKIPFKRNNIQKKLSSVESRRKVVLKSRQVGISTSELIRALDFVMFNPNRNACIIAHEDDSIEKLFRIVRRAYDYMHPSLKPRLDRGGGSKYEMFFPSIGSRIYCDLQSRGDTIHWLHISERAFIKDPMRVKATTEAVPFDTGVITVESTPNGIGNDFYTEWMDSNSNYAKCFFPWFFHEEYQSDNHELTEQKLTADEREFIKRSKSLYGADITLDQICFRRIKQNDLKETFKQEYPEDDATCFLTSGDSPFDLSIIKPLFDNAQKPLREVDGIKIYKEPKGGLYVLGADTAEGVEGDYSVATIFEVESREQVAVFRARIKPSDFGEKIVQLADMYSRGPVPILVAVERNNHGHAVLLYLDEIAYYPNLYRTRKENKKTEVEEIRLGWVTDKVTRPIMIDAFIEGVENGTVILNDKQTLAECLTLINDNGKIQAAEGQHDDTVIACAIAVQMCIEEGKLAVYSDIGSKIKL
jgi:hypothetical protein